MRAGSRAGATLKATLPACVRACVQNGGTWGLYFWRRVNPKEVSRVDFECGSWRCETCRRYEASVVFARIRDAFAKLKRDGIVLMVLTLDRDGFYSQKPWPDAATAYRELSRIQNKLMKRLDRWLARRGWTPIGNRWVATIETFGGMPHVNVMLDAPEFARALEEERLSRLAAGATEREATLFGGELLTHAVESGWGRQSTAEKARSVAAVNGYITKVAGHAERTAGEVAKLTQLPMNAPKRFHRLRSGKGFLAPRLKNETFTGTVVRPSRHPQRAAYAAEPMVRHQEMTIPMRCAQIEEFRMQGLYPPDSSVTHLILLSQQQRVVGALALRDDAHEVYDLRTLTRIVQRSPTMKDFKSSTQRAKGL